MTAAVDIRGSRAASPLGWRYWRAPADGLVEVGTLDGATAPLAMHFHDEVQITFVIGGQRTMVIGGRTIEIAAGRCVCIPAGVPHAGLAEPAGVIGLAIYVAAGAYAWDAMAAEIEALWRATSGFVWDDLAAIVRAHRLSAALPRDAADLAAIRPTLSREGYSRLFARRTGMPPHAFDLVARLNRARRLLQAGDPIASVAAETRFADQSHLGRWFKRSFGTTPAQYRRGHHLVTDVPDAPRIARL